MQTKKFETLGLSRDQAENLAVYLSEQIVLDRMRLSEKFTAKVELEKASSCVHDGMCIHSGTICKLPGLVPARPATHKQLQVLPAAGVASSLS